MRAVSPRRVRETTGIQPGAPRRVQRETGSLPEQDSDSATRQVRWATIVIVGAFLAWMGASALGGALGLPVRFAFLIDLACMAALIWALVVLFRVWRSRRNDGV